MCLACCFLISLISMLLLTLGEDLKMESSVSQGDREESHLCPGCDEVEKSIEEYKKEKCSLPRHGQNVREQQEVEVEAQRCMAPGAVSSQALASENALRSSQTQEKGWAPCR